MADSGRRPLPDSERTVITSRLEQKESFLATGPVLRSSMSVLLTDESSIVVRDTSTLRV